MSRMAILRPGWARPLSAALLTCLALTACETEEPAPAGDACASHKAGSDGWHEGKTASGLYIVRWKTEPDMVPKTLLTFTAEVKLTADDSSVSGDVELKGFMPEHGHGFEGYVPVPSSVPNNPGFYTVSGVSMGMLGRWELTLTVKAKAGEDAAKFIICL